jgi:hypothetical protein
MGSQKTAAKRKPNSGRSGTRKSVKENLPPALKLPYPKPRPAYKAASTSSTDAANVGNGEAAAVAALVFMRQSESAFNRTYRQIFNVPDKEDLNAPSEDDKDDDEDEDGREDEEDQLIESENEDSRKLRVHVIDIPLTAHITRSP